MRLLGMYYEAQYEIVRAQEIYIEMLRDNPNDTQTLKRLIAVYRDNDMMTEAIGVINKFLEVN